EEGRAHLAIALLVEAVRQVDASDLAAERRRERFHLEPPPHHRANSFHPVQQRIPPGNRHILARCRHRHSPTWNVRDPPAERSSNTRARRTSVPYARRRCWRATTWTARGRP